VHTHQDKTVIINNIKNAIIELKQLSPKPPEKNFTKANTDPNQLKQAYNAVGSLSVALSQLPTEGDYKELTQLLPQVKVLEKQLNRLQPKPTVVASPKVDRKKQ
jgi:hypothetical protein